MSRWGKMSGFFPDNDGMGKKSDDRKPSRNSYRPAGWHPTRAAPRRRLIKRIVAAVAVALFLYFFIHNIPTGLGPRNRIYRANYDFPEATPGFRGRIPPFQDSRPPPMPPAGQDLSEQAYNGPIRFLDLSISLSAIGDTRGRSVLNQNVLFAASSLKSASVLLPVACQMGVEKRNYVHFALMSRSDIDMEELRQLNGIDDPCNIIFHDARIDYPRISTDGRMEHGVFRAFHHINTHMHPQAIIVDGSNKEEGFFIRAARQQSKLAGNTLIELPRETLKSLLWMTKLDSAALKVWNKNQIDILVRATPGSSGSLIRLLKSLSMTDFTSHSIPHLTIELPHDIERSTKRYLESFQWPPEHVYNPTNTRYLSLRHRIPHRHFDETESSTKFLESFWPAQSQHSHILILSPQVEVSPQFFHYLKYSLLEYRYSAMAQAGHWNSRLFGISLEHPRMHINGETEFTAPLRQKTSETDDQAEGEMPIGFLWQAPTSNAVLFMGDKWMELHDFVSRTLETQQSGEGQSRPRSPKVVSKQHPSWLEHALSLARARGYWMLYPGEDTARNIATVHGELFRPPEEYFSSPGSKDALADDATDADIEKAWQKQRGGPEIALAPVSVLQGLPGRGNLPPFEQLPLLAWDGQRTDTFELDKSAAEFARAFKQTTGGCDTESLEKKRAALSAEDLFCTVL